MEKIPESSQNAYDSSLFSLQSNGQDSGIDFLSNRELYETSPDSFTHPQTTNGKCISNRSDILCPRHAKEQHEIKLNNVGGEVGNNNLPTDSSDNYEDSLKNDEQLISINHCQTNSPLSLNICDHRHHHHHQRRQRHRHHQHQQPQPQQQQQQSTQQQQQQQQPNYQNTNFEKRSCIRHSFHVKDDLMIKSSPPVALKPRGHVLRNSMNDLEERLNNLEQSFRRPIDFNKTNSIF